MKGTELGKSLKQKDETVDPNETLKEIRRLLPRSSKNSLLAQKVEELDQWLSKGGFLPDAWAQGE